MTLLATLLVLASAFCHALKSLFIKKSEDKQEKSPGEEQEQKQQQQQQAGEQQEQPQPGGKEQKKAEPMTPEEAERWLRSLKEGKRKQMQPEERQATGPYKPEKDW